MMIPWVLITAGMVGRAYELGQSDCLALILDAAEKRGVTLPDKFEGITRETYPAFWQRDRQAAKAALLRFVKTLGNEVPLKTAFTGDLLIMRARRNRELYIGIHAGHDRVITSFINKGIQTVNMRHFEIEGAFRMNANGSPD